MSKLDDLYKAKDFFHREGIQIDKKSEQNLNLHEEEFIKDEIIPILAKKIEPILHTVKSGLVLFIDYSPEKPLNIHFGLKRDLVSQQLETKEIILDPEVTHNQWKMKSEISHGPASDMTVIFPDGTIIAERKAVDTFVKVIKKIGVTRVREVVEEYNLTFCKVPVISNRRDKKYGSSQKDLGNGWLLITHSNNQLKKRFIEKISKILDLNIQVTLNQK